MSNCRAIAITLSLLVSSGATAQTIDESLEATSVDRLYVGNAVGSVEIDGWDRDEVRVTGTLGDAERVDIERRGDRIEVEVVYPRGPRNMIGAELEISAPRAVELDVEIVSADLDARGIQGRQDLSAVSGNIITEQFDASIEAASVSGSIHVVGHNENTDTRASTVSGDIELVNVHGDVRAYSVSGDVDVNGQFIERGEFETTSGDVSVRVELESESGRLEAASVSGDVILFLDGSAVANYQLTTLSGAIDNCFGPESERSSRYGPGRRLSFSEGETDTRVSLNTTSGDIELCRE